MRKETKRRTVQKTPNQLTGAIITVLLILTPHSFISVPQLTRHGGTYKHT